MGVHKGYRRVRRPSEIATRDSWGLVQFGRLASCGFKTSEVDKAEGVDGFGGLGPRGFGVSRVSLLFWLGQSTRRRAMLVFVVLQHHTGNGRICVGAFRNPEGTFQKEPQPSTRIDPAKHLREDPLKEP